MNFEGACALALILWIAFRSIPEAARDTTPPRRIDSLDVVLWLAICTAIAVVFWRAAHIGFLSDDFVLVAHAPDFNARRTFTSGGGDGFYRPLVYQFIWWTQRWAGANPALWHAAGLVVHAINAILLYLVAWALGYTRFVASFAAALFAVHGTRPEVAIWIGGRFDLFATMFVLAALFFLVRGYRLVALLAMIAGLLCKESAYAFPAMLLAIAVWRRDGRRNIVTYFGFAGAATLMFAYRWYLMGGIGGYRDSSGTPEILSLSLLGVVKGIALRLWAVLFLPVNWTARPGVLLWIVLAIYGAAVLWMAKTRVKRAAFLLPLTLLLATAVPVVHLLLIGFDLEKSRYLYLPSAMFAVLLAVVVDASKQKWMVASAILVFQVAALEHNLSGWETAAGKAESVCALVSESAPSRGARVAVLGLPLSLHGVYFYRNGLPECVELRNANHPEVTIQRDAKDPFDRANLSAVFEWDPVAEELKRRP